MKRKSLRRLSLFLATVMTVSQVNPGMLTVSAETETDVVEAVSQEATSQEVVGQETVAEEVNEVNIPMEPVTAGGTFAGEEVRRLGDSVPDSALLSTVVTDSSLLEAIVNIYNQAEGTDYNVSNMTAGLLKNYTGSLDFSATPNAQKITSVKGLGVAMNASSINISTLTGVKEIADGEFEGCAFSEFYMPSSLTKIGSKAFRSCTNLISITLPAGLTYIGDEAFNKCGSMTSVNTGGSEYTLPAGLTYIGQKAFLDNSSLKEISLPNFKDGYVLQNAVSLFSGCNVLEKIDIAGGVQIIPADAFYNAGSQSAGVVVTIAEGSKLEKIHSSAFRGVNYANKTIDLSNCGSLNAIAVHAFRDSESLENVILPAKVTNVKIGDYAFACGGLKNLYAAGNEAIGVTLPDYIDATIGVGAFYGNEFIESVSMPANLTAIPDYLFDGCIALAAVEQRQVNGSSDITFIGDCAFRGTAIKDTNFLMNMPKLVQIGRQTTDKYAIGSQKEDSIQSIPAGGENTTTKKFDISDLSSKKYDGKNCGSEVFTGCYALESVVLPGSVEIVGNRAFYFANKSEEKSLLKSVNWNNAAKAVSGKTRKIYPEAFRGCGALETLMIPENAGETLEIGKCAFYEDKSLVNIGQGGTATQKLPNTVTSIGDGAFMNCEALQELHIQAVNKKAPTLGNRVFEGCISMHTSSLPKEIEEIPHHFYAECPLTSFNFEQMTNVTSIGNLAFFGHQFININLYSCTKLQEIGAGAFSMMDTVKKTSYMSPKGEDLDTDKAPMLEIFILPRTVEEELFLDSGVFSGQLVFDTMHNGTLNEDTIVIPAYAVQGGKGIFTLTGVRKVVWEADSNGSYDESKYWKKIPENTFEACMNIQKASDVLPKHVETIGLRTFAESGVQEADLANFKKLKSISSGKLDYNDITGAFTMCPALTKVSLPVNTGNEVKVGEHCFYASDRIAEPLLKEVDLGDAVSLGKGAFMGCTALTEIDLKKVEEVGEGCFGSCTSLATIKFTDSQKKLGKGAFRDTEALTSVKFGSGIEELGESVFENSNISKVDFGNASVLATIGKNAFKGTNLTEFKLTGTKVAQIQAGTLQACQSLVSATLGEEVLYVDKDAISGCPKFKNFEFYGSTTINQGIFHSTPTVEKVKLITGQENGNKGLISVTVETPSKTIIPLGRDVEFPFYVNMKSTSDIQSLRIYDEKNEDNLAVEKYLSVEAKVDDGYYKGYNSDEQNGKYRVSDKYFNNLEVANAKKIAATGKEVDIVNVKGLEVSSGTDLKFEIIANLNFTCADEDVKIQSSAFNATYNVEVIDPVPMATLYTDKEKTKALSNNVTMQVVNSSKAKQYYYTIEDVYGTGMGLENFNLVIETSNPKVIYPGKSSSASSATTYTTTATKTSSSGTVSTNKNSMNFYLIPAGIGTATISVYPEGCNATDKEKYKKVYTITVNSDVQKLKLAIPSDYSKEANPGDKFCVFDSYTNYFNETCSVKNMAQFKKLTNKNITFTSSDSKYVSVDQYGNVKVLKADSTEKKVKIIATAQNSADGKKVESSVQICVKNPTAKKNQEVVDTKTGTKVKITKTSTKDLEGEVEFEGMTSKSATKIVVPNTVEIYGIKYKVTTIKSGLYKGNKKIKTVTIGANIEEIEDEAFSGCTSLTSVTIGKNVETIGDKAFYNCKKLNKVKFSSKKNLKTIGQSAFQSCVKLTKISIPGSVEKIDNKAFYNCKKLKTVTFAKKAKLNYIGTSAFAKCGALKKITIPVNVKTIGSKAFYNCKKLKTITVKSKSVSSIGTDAFKGIYKKATIKVPKSKLSTYKTLFANKGQKKTVKIKK